MSQSSSTTTTRSRIGRAWRPLLLAAWSATILVAGSTPDLRVSHDDALDRVLRTIGHAVAYGALAAIASMTARQEGARPWTAAILALVMCGALGTIDELHQRTVDGRVGSVGDVVVDLTGAAIVLTVSLLLGARRRAAITPITEVRP